MVCQTLIESVLLVDLCLRKYEKLYQVIENTSTHRLLIVVMTRLSFAQEEGLEGFDEVSGNLNSNRFLRFAWSMLNLVLFIATLALARDLLGTVITSEEDEVV